MKFIILILLIFLVPVCFSGCSGCSKSGRIKSLNGEVNVDRNFPKNETKDDPIDESIPEPKVDHASGPPVTIKMRKQGGIYIIPMKINGIELDFIFDTGAGSISISDLEASLLYKQGKITQEDILGKQNFEDATGRISEGAVINLKEVSIGGRTIHNVKASVVHNSEAPLLLGQTVLQRFGKITIDYDNSEITFQ